MNNNISVPINRYARRNNSDEYTRKVVIVQIVFIILTSICIINIILGNGLLLYIIGIIIAVVFNLLVTMMLGTLKNNDIEFPNEKIIKFPYSNYSKFPISKTIPINTITNVFFINNILIIIEYEKHGKKLNLFFNIKLDLNDDIEKLISKLPNNLPIRNKEIPIELDTYDKQMNFIRIYVIK